MISSLSEYIKEQKSMIIKLDNINIIKVLVGHVFSIQIAE